VNFSHRYFLLVGLVFLLLGLNRAANCQTNLVASYSCYDQNDVSIPNCTTSRLTAGTISIDLAVGGRCGSGTLPAAEQYSAIDNCPSQKIVEVDANDGYDTIDLDTCPVTYSYLGWVIATSYIFDPAGSDPGYPGDVLRVSEYEKTNCNNVSVQSAAGSFLESPC
jgi:hypothetical protein